MGNIGNELKKSLNRLGISRQVEAVGVVETAQKEIAKFVPAEDFEVISFKGGVLKITTKNPVAASEIQGQSSQILEVLPRVNKLRIRIS